MEVIQKSAYGQAGHFGSEIFEFKIFAHYELQEHKNSISSNSYSQRKYRQYRHIE